MKKVKKIMVAVLLLAISGTGYGFYLYNKKPADVRKQAAHFELSAAALVAAFNQNETDANRKYTDKVIAVRGRVADIKVDAGGQATVFLEAEDPMAAVTCSFYKEEAAGALALQAGTEITIKGKCTGKLMDVVLNKCSINQ